MSSWWRLGQADEDVEAEVFFAQVFEVVAFRDLDAAVAGGEGVAVLGDPGGSDDDALGVLVFHGAGQCADYSDSPSKSLGTVSATAQIQGR
jgi:hypothetical protein